MVSIIVPVYNVEKYLDKCLESLVNQTFKDIEIVLINDGSKDNSLAILKKWEKTDSRIIVYDKENEGLGETRNYGVRVCKGEYIMYVDSDDWVDITIVEKLYNSLIKFDSDISVCDRYSYREEVCDYEYIKNNIDNKDVIHVKDNKKIIFDISTVAYAKMYKKQLILDNNIKQPDGEWEDIIIPVTLALAEKISYVNEALYFWVSDRSGSITNSLDFLDNIKYLEYLVSSFKNHNIYDSFYNELLLIAKYRASWNTKKAIINVDQNYRDQMTRVQKYAITINKFFAKNNMDIRLKYDNEDSDLFYVLGSYNLMIVAKIITRALLDEKIDNHYSFSGLVSIMSDYDEQIKDIEFSTKNEYRFEHLYKDLYKKFKSLGRAEVSKSNILLIDFLEERFPVGKLENDNYITLSDAFFETDLKNKIDYTLIDIFTDDYFELWKTKCDDLIKLLQTRYFDKKIVLVKMKLTSKYGTHEDLKSFDVDNTNINNLLEKQYQYFINNYNDVFVVDVENSKYFYTDEKYRHGCLPWHLNVEMYRELANVIKEFMYETN